MSAVTLVYRMTTNKVVYQWHIERNVTHNDRLDQMNVFLRFIKVDQFDICGRAMIRRTPAGLQGFC